MSFDRERLQQIMSETVRRDASLEAAAVSPVVSEHIVAPVAPPQVHVTVNTGVPEKVSHTPASEPQNNTSDDLRKLREDVRDLARVVGQSQQQQQTETQNPLDLGSLAAIAAAISSAGRPESVYVPVRNRFPRWPFVTGAAVLAFVGAMYFYNDAVKEWACEQRPEDPACAEEVVAEAGGELDETGSPVIEIPRLPGAPSDDQSIETPPTITAPPIPNTPPRPANPPPIGDGESAPGELPDLGLNDETMYLRSATGELVPMNVQGSESLISESTAYMLEEIEPNVFVADEDAQITWQTLQQDTTGQVYVIKMRQNSASGGYLSDQTFGTYLNSDQITDRELLQFLTFNKIVPNYMPTLYVEIVGHTGQILRTIGGQ